LSARAFVLCVGVVRPFRTNCWIVGTFDRFGGIAHCHETARGNKEDRSWRELGIVPVPEFTRQTWRGWRRAVLAGRQGQGSGYRAAGPVTVAIRRCGTHALRAGTDGFDRRQPGPLVLVQEPAQLGVFGPEAAELVVTH